MFSEKTSAFNLERVSEMKSDLFKLAVSALRNADMTLEKNSKMHLPVTLK